MCPGGASTDAAAAGVADSVLASSLPDKASDRHGEDSVDALRMVAGSSSRADAGRSVDDRRTIRTCPGGALRSDHVHDAAYGFGGIPLLFSGDELAQRNDAGYLADLELAPDNRWMHRPPRDWAAAARAAADAGNDGLLPVDDGHVVVPGPGVSWYARG